MSPQLAKSSSELLKEVFRRVLRQPAASEQAVKISTREELENQVQSFWSLRARGREITTTSGTGVGIKTAAAVAS